jgi:triacylglycerol esterase/lipase EstA (alpha/beta hydrolase family)
VERITDHANNLLLLVDSERNSDVRNSPSPVLYAPHIDVASQDYYQRKIIFIGHSLGGLIIKQVCLLVQYVCLIH